jgi:hypothetical protein
MTSFLTIPHDRNANNSGKHCQAGFAYGDVSFFVSGKRNGVRYRVNEPPSTDRRYPMLPATITSRRQAIKEIKSFGCEGWEGESRVGKRTQGQVFTLAVSLLARARGVLGSNLYP